LDGGGEVGEGDAEHVGIRAYAGANREWWIGVSAGGRGSANTQVPKCEGPGAPGTWILVFPTHAQSARMNGPPERYGWG